MKEIFIAFSLLLTSCTVNISMAHSAGSSVDTFDDTDSVSASPQVSIPAKLL